MVTRDGHVKILDFGLAKLSLAAACGRRRRPDRASTTTSPGLVLGTVGYMSPEQAAANAVDFRADQFSLGAVLYEMLRDACVRAADGGRNPGGDHPRGAPIRSTLAPQTPLPLQWVIDRCLAKDPDERYRSTRDLARDLVNLRDHLSDGSASDLRHLRWPRRPRRLAMRCLWRCPVLALAAATAGWLRPARWPRRRRVRDSPWGTRGATYAPLETSRGVAISPDGTRLSIEAYAKGRRQLFLRRLDADESVPIEGSADATGHFWSPDSRFIAFYANGKLKKVPAEGGTAQDLCAAHLRDRRIVES